MKSIIYFLLYSLLNLSLYSQWSSDPSQNFQISDLNGDQATPLITATTDGGCYISWFDKRSSNYDVYLQRLNATGYKQFANDGLLISSNPQNSSLVGYSLTVDANNNAVLVFTDIRNGGAINPFAYLISPSGVFLWGSNGVTLSDSVNSFQPNPKIAVTSDGNYVFVWRLGSGPQKIAMQKLNAAGVKQWGSGPIIISSGTTENYDWPEITSSDNGSIIMMWSGYTGSFINPVGYKIYTQKFSSSGARVWNSSQDTAYSLGRVSGFYNPKIFSDGNNGAIYCWQDDRNSANVMTGYVQRKTSTGSFLFPANGSAVSTLAGMNHFSPISSVMQSTGETYTFFVETNSLQNQFSVFGQKFSANGTRQWTEQGIQFTKPGTNQPSFLWTFTKDTNIVVNFSETQTPVSTIYIKAFKSNRSGALQWGVLTASNVISSKLRMQSAMNSSGMCMMTWSDNRNDIGGIYAQNINYDGTLGNPSGIELISSVAEEFFLSQNYPNPFNPFTKIRFSVPSNVKGETSNVKLIVYDIFGREVATLVNEELKPGMYKINFDGSNFSSGVYYYRITAGDFDETKRMVLIK